MNVEHLQRNVEETVAWKRLCLFVLLGSFFLPERKGLLPQEKKHNMKEVLDWRKDELKFLKREKTCVDSLLRLCEQVKHLIKGDTPKSEHERH